MSKIFKYVIYDIVRNKIIIAYTLFLLLVTLSIFAVQTEGDAGKSILSLMNIILIVVPLISIIFSTIHFYNSYEFIELLVAQPLNRTKIIASEYLGSAVALSLAYVIGVGLPIMFFFADILGFCIVLVGILITFIFTSLAFMASVFTSDKAKGIGLSLLLWFYFSLIYDGLILYILTAFEEYPLEKVAIFLSAFNPIDLARIIILLQTDVSALMGYTGAVYRDFLGNLNGIVVAASIMLIWAALPIFFAVKRFAKKDL